MNTGDTHGPNNSGGAAQPVPGYPGPPPGPGFGGYAPAPPAPPQGPPPTSFFSALFDFNFNSYVTPKVVKVVYILMTVIFGLWLLFGIASAFSASLGFGLLALIIGPLLFIVWLALFRIVLEFYVAVIKISEDVKELKRR
ncbi:DUF4282 domain-containing protein [Rhodococcus hoagii]|nr:DUF4282 domain-containing protein [Prescottella equi]